MPLDLAAPPPSAECAAAARAAPPRFDARRLKQGRFTYDMTIKGEAAGQFVLTIRREGKDRWRFTGDATGFDQHWEAVTTRRFEPVSALLNLKRKGQPYRMELSYGLAGVTAGETTGAETRTTTTPFPSRTVDQRIDWASMMASDLAPGGAAAWHVFDAMTGSSRLVAGARAIAPMDGPLGRQPAIRLDYRICKAGRAAETYRVYATRSLPRVMLREDLRDEEVSVLVKAEP
jgi:hypothetical protein